jgi:metal-responsive CopG/Arc/MetJ family transcriptional regulator
MNRDQPTEPITVRATKEIVSEIDALAAAMDRSRNYVINQALRHYLETNAWQIERIKEGLLEIPCLTTSPPAHRPCVAAPSLSR